MIRRPPRSTRTDTLFPYTTLFRSDPALLAVLRAEVGRSVLTPDSAAMRAIKLAEPSPNRVAVSKAGRIEVYARLRSEEHTSELQSLMRISYAVFCLKKKKEHHNRSPHNAPMKKSNTHITSKN